MTSNRSPSPLSTRPNPNSGNSETHSSIRRSFNGNPFAKPSLLTNPRSYNPTTPVNSPADHTKRQSLGREGNPSSRFCEEKENESKAAKIQSPVTKGSKNFMSPTISAASKFTPSPRKKILSEKNELTRTSIQFSDSKTPLLSMEDNSDPKSETLSDQTKIDHKEVVLEVPPNSQVTLNSKDESEILSVVTENSDCVNVESSSKDKSFCSSTVSPIIAPLDADPSLPPYDPKTNFLSPRPRFLHYKPNPRIEVFFNKDKGVDSGEFGNRLEESFVLLENSSDTDVTEESLSEDLNKESEDLSSVETISEEEKDLVISEPIAISTPTPEQTFETKRVSKPKGFFKRSIATSLLLVFLIACVMISLTDSPVIDSSVFKDASFSKLYYEPSKFAAFAKANLDEFANSFKQRSSNSISYLSDLKYHLSESDKFSHIQFINLTTAPQEDFLVDGYAEANLDDKKLKESKEGESVEEIEAEIGKTTEGEFDVDDNIEEESEKEDDGEIEVEQVHQQELDVDDNSEEESENAVDAEIEVEQVHQQELDVGDNSEKESEIEVEQVMQSLESDAHLQISTNAEDGSVLILNIPESKPEEIELPEVRTELEFFYNKPKLFASDLNSPAEIESPAAEIAESELVDSLGSANLLLSVKTLIGVSLILLSMVAATIFIYMKQGKTTAPNTMAHVIDPLVLSKKEASKQELSHNWETEVDLVGESCPSEMSSFQKSTSYSKRAVRDTSEAQSQEKRPRKNYKRESLASSSGYSMGGSPSYGSFTTYERIPIKKASGEEEMLTPIRQSSRLVSRNQVTSS